MAEVTVSVAPVLRAKFRVNTVKQSVDKDGAISTVEIEANAVYGGNGTENAQWSKLTPSGSLKMNISNPAAFDTLRVGAEYYIDFTPAPAEPV